MKLNRNYSFLILGDYSLPRFFENRCTVFVYVDTFRFIHQDKYVEAEPLDFSMEVSFMRWLPIAFLTNGALLTHGGIEVTTTPAL